MKCWACICIEKVLSSKAILEKFCDGANICPKKSLGREGFCLFVLRQNLKFTGMNSVHKTNIGIHDTPYSFPFIISVRHCVKLKQLWHFN